MLYYDPIHYILGDGITYSLANLDLKKGIIAILTTDGVMTYDEIFFYSLVL